MLPWNEDWCQFTPKTYRVSIIPMWGYLDEVAITGVVT